MPTRRSLAGLHPRKWHVPIGLGAALALLVAGLLLPVLRIEKLVFWEDDYSIIDGALSLWRNGHWILSTIILAFSVVFPAAKLLGLLAVWFTPLHDARRARIIRLIDLLGRWSMLDVFVVAVTIVLTSSRAALDAVPRAGLYVFTGAVVLSMLITLEMERLAGGRRRRRA